MNFLQTLLTAFLATLFMSKTLNAASFTFLQGGYSEGAFVSGTFEGSDTNNDGSILYEKFQAGALGEVTNFSLRFSGNSTVAPFSLPFGDLFQLMWNTEDGVLDGDRTALVQSERISADGISMGSGTFFGGGSRLSCDGFNACGQVVGPNGFSDTTTQAITVTAVPVPLPTSITLLALGMGAFAFKRKNIIKQAC